MAFSTKIRLDHFIEQVKVAAHHEGQNDQMIKDALEVFADMHHGNTEPTEHFHLGFLITELMGAMSDHYQDLLTDKEAEIEELEASEAVNDARIDELEDRLIKISKIAS